MKEEEKQRLNEIKLSLYINHIDKSQDKIEYNMLVKTLSALAASLGKEAHEIFIKIFQKSIADGLIGASTKEIVYVQEKYFSAAKMSKLFDKNIYWFKRKYCDMTSRNFVTTTFLESLKPRFNEQEERNVVNFMLNFIENFNYEFGNDDVEITYHNRSLELEFYMLYQKIMEITRSVKVTNNFVYNICTLLNMDYSSISYLKNNAHVIDRTFPNFRYNKRYFMQELCTLYTKKGLSKGAIGSKVLGKGTNFLFNNTNKEYGKVIKEEDMEWEYVPTLEWDLIDKNAVIKFITTLHKFIKYNE